MTERGQREPNKGPTPEAQLYPNRSKSTMTLIKMTMTTTTGRTTSSLTTATTTLTKVGIETPMKTNPVTTATPTTTTPSQPMTNKQRRRTAAEEKPPQVPSGFPVMLTGHARKHLKRERLPMFWSQSTQNPQLPSSWRKMVWIVSMRSKN